MERAVAARSAAAKTNAVNTDRQPSQQGGLRQRQGDLVEAVLAGSAWPHVSRPLVDIGANLVDTAFDKDRAAVLERAIRSGVSTIIVTGSSVESSAAAAVLCDEVAGGKIGPSDGATSTPQLPDLYFTAGVHPHYTRYADGDTLTWLRELARHPRCVAIGECGLDFNRNLSLPEVQEEWFAKQAQLAVELRKPLFLHCRDAAAALASTLQRIGLPLPASAVVHCFTGSVQELRMFLDMGLHMGVTGWVCDDRPERGAQALRDALPLIPSDRLMIETDAPYLTPRTIKPSRARPSRNEPALLPLVLSQVAAATGRDVEQLARDTTAVAQRVFGIPIQN